VIAGHLLNKVTPVIPREVLNARVSGVVVMHVIIGKDGNVETVSVISEAPAMRQPVVDAVKQWTYRPYLLNGHPVKVGTTVTCDLVFGAASGK
jgi:protein TonB